MTPAPKSLSEQQKLRIQSVSLLMAARNGEESKVRRLLGRKKLDVDVRDKSGRTPLMLALEGPHEETVEAIFEFCPDVHVRSKSGETALQMAFEFGLECRRVVRLFLKVLEEESGYDVHELAKVLKDVGCPLYLAALLKNSKVTSLMLQNGSAVDAADPGTLQTALHVAVGLRDHASVKVLIESGANVDAMDWTNSIPLAGYEAEDFDDSEEELEMLRLLTDGCTKLTTRNFRGLLQVRFALQFGKKEALRILVRSEIDWCAPDMFGLTPLCYLADNEALVGNQDVLEGLKGKVIYDEARDRESVRSLPFVSSYGITNLVEMLLDSGADPNAEDSNRHTALLSTSVFRGTPQQVEERRRTFMLLLQRGADPQILTSGNTTVFEYIVRSKNYHLAEAAIGQLLMDESQGRQITAEVRDTIDSDQTLKNQLLRCKNQLDKLKRSEVRLSLTLFDVLTESEKTIAGYARNEEFCDKMENFKLYSENTYFDYIVRQKFEKTMESVRMRKGTIDLVCKMTNVCYNSYPTIVDKITDYIYDM